MPMQAPHCNVVTINTYNSTVYAEAKRKQFSSAPLDPNKLIWQSVAGHMESLEPTGQGKQSQYSKSQQRHHKTAP